MNTCIRTATCTFVLPSSPKGPFSHTRSHYSHNSLTQQFLCSYTFIDGTRFVAEDRTTELFFTYNTIDGDAHECIHISVSMYTDTFHFSR